MPAAGRRVDERDFRDTLSRRRGAICLANVVAPPLGKPRCRMHCRPNRAERILDQELDDVVLSIDARRRNDIRTGDLEALLGADAVEDPILLLRVPILIGPPKSVRCNENILAGSGLTLRRDPAREQFDTPAKSGN